MNCLTPTRAMRMLFFLCIGISCRFAVSAQGIYQNRGVTYEGGPDNISGIFSADSAAGNAPGITISPNPVINMLTVNGAVHFKQLEIIDASGKTVRLFTASASNQYNVAGLQQGIYMLRFVGDKEVKGERCVKQ